LPSGKLLKRKEVKKIKKNKNYGVHDGYLVVYVYDAII
jgi:hypothetical protein